MINFVLATLAAGAAAFALFAMPADLLEKLVGTTGISAWVSAAEPPLGVTARLGVMAVAAAVAFGLVWLTLRAFDPPQRSAEARFIDEANQDGFAVRPRRSDAHPDAPLRRPLLARADLGEPLEELYRGAEPAQSPDDSRPSASRALIEHSREPAGTETLELQVEQIAPDPIRSDREPMPDPTSDDDQVHWDPAPLHLHADDDEDGMTTEELLARLPISQAASATVSSLLDRLDAGLAACEWPLVTPDSPQREEDMDERLRSVLQDLQKMAGGA